MADLSPVLTVSEMKQVPMLCQVSVLSIYPSDIPIFRFQMIPSHWPFQPELHHLSCSGIFWTGCCSCSLFVCTCVSVHTFATDEAIFFKLLLAKSQICSLSFAQWYLGLSLSFCFRGALRYLIWKLIRSSLCWHSWYLGFNLNFAGAGILLNGDLERLWNKHLCVVCAAPCERCMSVVQVMVTSLLLDPRPSPPIMMKINISLFEELWCDKWL